MLNRDDDSFMCMWVINVFNMMCHVVILLQHHCVFQNASKSNIAPVSWDSEIVIIVNTFTFFTLFHYYLFF